MKQDVNLTYNAEMEREVLASLLSRPEVFDELGSSLSRELFTDLGCIKVYDIICQMVAEGKRPELTEVGIRMVAVGEDVAKYMTGQAGTLPITRQRITTLEEMRLRREIYQLCYRGLTLANDPTTDIESVNDLVNDFRSLMSKDKDSEVQKFGQVMKEVQNEVAERMQGKAVNGIMTGLHIFDSHYGLHEGDLVIVCGYPSHGKTTLATTIAKNVARNGVPSVFYSMEMSARQLTARMMAGDTNVSASKILYGRMNDEEYSRFFDGTSQMAGLPIYFDERNKTSLTKIASSVRRMVRHYGVRIVFIDYLQILANGGRLDSREQILGDMARDLKRLAVETNTCIVALSQLNRSDKEKDKEPTIGNIRGSGQIEEACDEAVVVYRPQLSGVSRYKNGQSTEGSAKITIGKGRNVGTTAEVVRYNGALSFFADYEDGDPRAPSVEQKEELPF